MAEIRLQGTPPRINEAWREEQATRSARGGHCPGNRPERPVVRALWARGVTNKAERGQAGPGPTVPTRSDPRDRWLVGWSVGWAWELGAAARKRLLLPIIIPSMWPFVEEAPSVSSRNPHLRFIDLPVVLFGLPFVISSFLSVCRLSVTSPLALVHN
ncbi:unnamed protein product [Calypogeia fissa]